MFGIWQTFYREIAALKQEIQVLKGKHRAELNLQEFKYTAIIDGLKAQIKKRKNPPKLKGFKCIGKVDGPAQLAQFGPRIFCTTHNGVYEVKGDKLVRLKCGSESKPAGCHQDRLYVKGCQGSVIHGYTVTEEPESVKK